MNLWAGETVQLLGPNSVRPCTCFCLGSVLHRGDVFLQPKAEFLPVVVGLGCYACAKAPWSLPSLYCLMKEQVSYWWPQKGRRKKKSTLLSILWRPSFGYWYPLSGLPRITEGYSAQTQLDRTHNHVSDTVSSWSQAPSFVVRCLAQDLICPESLLDGWLNTV